MPDKLDWTKEHLVLHTHLNVADVVSKENYKIPFALRQLALEYPFSEDFFNKLREDKKFKEANEFLAYNIHKRALAWWSYCVVLSLIKELKENPPEKRNIEDIGKPRKLEVPDWAKMPEDNEPPVYDKLKEQIEKAKQLRAEYQNVANGYLKQGGPELEAAYNKAKSIVWDAFKQGAGV